VTGRCRRSATALLKVGARSHHCAAHRVLGLIPPQDVADSILEGDLSTGRGRGQIRKGQQVEIGLAGTSELADFIGQPPFFRLEDRTCVEGNEGNQVFRRTHLPQVTSSIQGMHAAAVDRTVVADVMKPRGRNYHLIRRESYRPVCHRLHVTPALLICSK
jgi:hypothetical protein